MKKDINLGDRVKDIVTGFTGIAAGRYEYMTGCTQYGVAPEKLKDGAVADWATFDESRLTIVKRSAVKLRKAPEIADGGPSPFVGMGPRAR
jgi:hypothetical protein